MVQAFNSLTGALVWTSQVTPGDGPLSEVVESGPYLMSIGASFGSGQFVTVYKVSTGQRVWSHASDGCFGSPALIVHGAVIYNVCDNDAGTQKLEADSLTTGQKLWTRAGAWQIMRGSDLGGNGHVYAINPSGQMTDLIATTGVTRFHLAGATGVLAVDNGRVYAQCGLSAVCGYLKATGVWQWSVADSSSLAAEAAGALYLADGSVLNTANGQILTSLWQATATDIAVGEGQVAVVDGPTLDLYGLRHHQPPPLVRLPSTSRH